MPGVLLTRFEGMFPRADFKLLMAFRLVRGPNMAGTVLLGASVRLEADAARATILGSLLYL